jgi:hypothetical protein
LCRQKKQTCYHWHKVKESTERWILFASLYLHIYTKIEPFKSYTRHANRQTLKDCNSMYKSGLILFDFPFEILCLYLVCCSTSKADNLCGLHRNWNDVELIQFYEIL